ncbi:c-Myc-binding protein [Vitis vinifera]|uniref:c-Myc-binding protein n=1 Tax=Vitis vinifera TaxID=29760 RepID=A0A438DFH6_VITVI|nr:c-Myc-binding protein [Vitis vinifera]
MLAIAFSGLGGGCFIVLGAGIGSQVGCCYRMLVLLYSDLSHCRLFFWLLKCSSLEEKEAKKEAFRKYLESSGVLDALTKVLVALYEQNDKPSSAVEFVQQKLGGPTVSEYEKLQGEMLDLQIKYNELLAAHQETCRQA